MKRALIAFILSALTFFGGHYYNRRWARSTFFSVLVILWFLLSGPLAFWLFMLSDLTNLDFQVSASILTRVWSAGLAVIWLASAIIAAIDARNPQSDVVIGGVFSKWFSILSMCVIGTLLVGLTHASWLLRGKAMRWLTEREISEPIEIVTKAPPITERKRYLGSGSYSFEEFDHNSKKVLAKGPGTIQGKVVVNDKACSGLRFRLFLSGDLRTQWTESDENGLYEIPVPFGKYRYQGFELDTESANKVLAGKIKKADYFDRERIITVAEGMPASGQDFYFIDPVLRIRPLGDTLPSDGLVFEWEPYPEAAFYRIQIYDRGVRSWGFEWKSLLEWHDRPKVENTQVSMSELGATLESGHYYSWRVEAFDRAGDSISRTENAFEIGFKVK